MTTIAGKLLKEKFEEVGYGWDVKGVIDSAKRIYTLTDDTKLISKVFELVSRPVIYAIADENDLVVHEASSQTIYPDFTLEGEALGKKKVAVDLKSTYRRFLRDGKTFRAAFTLGGYTSFLRNPTKNILFPYHEYSEHWIVGFIYTRDPAATDVGIVPISDIDEIIPILRDIDLIVDEKYRIASESPGSGNTANIGSVKTIEELREGRGPFAPWGPPIFEDYWRNYMTNGMARHAGVPRPFTSLGEYVRWRASNPAPEVELPRELLAKYGVQ